MNMDLVGSTIAGKYRIESFLNQGGMGAVYRATHLMLEREVVIKVIRPELVTSKESISRFQREARAASQLTHPNIVNVFDLGETEDGALYIAMELVDGISLADLLEKEGALEPSRAAKLIEGVCSGLSLAHEEGVIHRDLKPANIMVVTDREGNESPKILDFGIAKTFDTHAASLTATGMMLGSPHYMSPEQANGREVDARADIYALGIILFEVLTGKLAFTGDTPMAVLFKHMGEIPRRPSELNPGVPPALDAIVLRCLEKEREKRFGSARDLAHALRSGLEGAPRSAPRPQPAEGLPAATEQTDDDFTRAETYVLVDSSGSNRTGSRWKIVAGSAAAIVAIVALAWLGTRGGESDDPSGPRVDTGVVQLNHGAETAGVSLNGDRGETAEAEQRAEEQRREQEKERLTVERQREREQEFTLERQTRARGDLEDAIQAGEEIAVRRTIRSLGDLLGTAAVGDADLTRAARWLSDRENERQREEEAQEESERLAQQELRERQESAARVDLALAMETSDENAVRSTSVLLRDLLGSGAASDVDLTGAASWLSDREEQRQDLTMWRSLEGSQSPERYEAYLATYPNGQFADEARDRLPDLRAADEYRRGSDFFSRSDYEKAVLHFRLACDGDNVDGCVSLGIRYKNNEGVPQDHNQAVLLFRKACDGGSSSGCSNLGAMYERGEGVTRDYVQAASLYDKACDGGSAAGCSNLGTMYEYGDGVAKNLARAKELHGQACDRGIEKACESLKNLQ